MGEVHDHKVHFPSMDGSKFKPFLLMKHLRGLDAYLPTLPYTPIYWKEGYKNHQWLYLTSPNCWDFRRFVKIGCTRSIASLRSYINSLLAPLVTLYKSSLSHRLSSVTRLSYCWRGFKTNFVVPGNFQFKKNTASNSGLANFFQEALPEVSLLKQCFGMSVGFLLRVLRMVQKKWR